MKTTYECETEVVKCAYESGKCGESFSEAGAEAALFAHTKAYVNGLNRMLKIEHHCYLRSGSDISDQSWIKPGFVIEPSPGPGEEIAVLVAALHSQFVEKARAACPELYPA